MVDSIMQTVQYVIDLDCFADIYGGNSHAPLYYDQLVDLVF